jgi:DNA repair protein RecN (Recombination protein N)
LDVFAGTGELVQQFREVYRQRYDLNKQAKSLREQLDSHLKEQALLSYQLEEIERLGLRVGEEESLETKLKKLENSEQLKSKSQLLEEILSEGEVSLTSLIGRARLLASELSATDSDLDPMLHELKNIESQIKDLAAQIRDYGESIVMDERELESLRERCGVLWDLKRKHGMTVDQIITRAGELKGLLEHGESLNAQIVELKKMMDDLDHKIIQLGSELSSKRNASAPELSKKIGERLRPLGFNKPRFNIAIESDAEISPDTVGRSGADRVQFQIAVNPGSNLAGLSDVASGGESSRVLLAVKSVLAEKMHYPLSIYDEIDLGISGQIAERVGSELARMGKRHQLMVISHLPQIASSADHHLYIEKKLTGTSAVTGARFLKDEERVAAVAALMAGRSVTKQLLASADELLQQRKNPKKAKSLG